MEDTELKKALETLLFIADHPLPVDGLAQLCEVKNQERVKALLDELKAVYDGEERALQIMQVAGGWQMSTRPAYSLWVRKLYHNKMTVRLTQAALETLCIIAYKQPLTRAEIEAIRGVEVIGPLDTLTERRLITVVGRRETTGRPILYGTTTEFLRQFGLNTLSDLPKLENFNVENPAASAQATAVELVEEESATALEEAQSAKETSSGPIAGEENQAAQPEAVTVPEPVEAAPNTEPAVGEDKGK
ncbi:MAG TPA: SMC-Scp complex subunit ScpB [Elusimicrobia bacterium]|nr:SMC-Scp complex subunit ScpB [Elusimicrobiota bacterium]